MITGQNKARSDFLSGAGEMGARIRACDWSRTPLGPAEQWPPELKTSVSLMLASPHPMWIGSGPEMTLLYNDACLPVLGAAALAKPAAEAWAGIWDVCGPPAGKVLDSGEAATLDGVRLLLDRGAYQEEAFYSFSYSPIRGDSGQVCGLLCLATDVTPKLVNARRLATLSELASRCLAEKTVAGACAAAAQALRNNAGEVPFALLYLAGAEGREARLVQAAGDFAPDFAPVSQVSLEEDSPPWPLAAVYRSAQRRIVDASGMEGLPRGAAGQPVREAVVLPVISGGGRPPCGVLVAGVNPGRPLDADHLAFFDLLAAQVGAAVHSARAGEQEQCRAAPEAGPPQSPSLGAEGVSKHQQPERASLLLGAIVDSSHDAIISKDLNGVVTSWNKSAERLFGYTAEEAIGRTVMTLLIPADRHDEEREILERLRRGERVDHFETVRRHKDGRLLDVSVAASPIKDARGNIIGASNITRDISDRKHAETAIRDLNARLTSELAAMTRMQQLSTRLVAAGDFVRLLEDILDAAAAITGADMGYIQLDEGGLLRIACSRGFGREFLEVFEAVRPAQTASGAALQRRERVIVEDVASSTMFDGALRDALLAAGARALQSTPLITRSGETLGVFSTHYRVAQGPGEREQRLLDLLARQAADLIERRRAEIALLESERKFRQLADAMPQIVWTADAAGRPDYFNQRWYQFTGLEPGRFDRQTWEGILHPEDFQAAARLWAESVEKGEPFRAQTRLWDRAERRWRWFISRALPVRGAQGGVVKWFGTSTDIDEQKRVEAELRRANQDLEQFAYSVSHDLQEPLRSIKIYGELLSRRYGGRLDGQALEFLEYLRTGASRMEMLLRDLLAYTQVTRLDPPEEPADTLESLQASLANLSGAIAESGARVTHDPLPPLRLHATHLRQLFQNLIGNAIKYRHRDRPPRIHISAAREAGAWIVSVQDNGIGLPPEYKEHIFGLFKRLHCGDEYSGTGIGLAICQRIVERYHGRIWVESEAGTGSVFRFSIPL